MLEITYHKEHLQIILRLTNDLDHWPQVRDAVIDHAEEYSIGSYTINLPVWSFFSSRTALGYVLNRYQIPFSLDATSREILNKLITRETEFRISLTSTKLSEEELIDELEHRCFIRPLTSHQVRNVLKLYSLPAGATFSVPGAGKTTEALAYFVLKRNKNEKLLVVCPKNAFAPWEEQISLCCGTKFTTARLVGGEKNIESALATSSDIYLITYQQLPNVKNLIATFLVSSSAFMFLDESHRIKKGIGGLWCSTILDIAHLPISKLIMSGTPLPNGESDLLPQYKFLYPEVNAETQNIQDLIRPVFVRTTKKELGLPKPTITNISISLSPEQRILYDLIRSEEARKVSGLETRDKMKLRKIGKSVMRLLQLVSNPALLLKQSVDLPKELYSTLEAGDSPKLSYACFRARNLAKNGYKVIIWSNFVENVEVIANRLADIGADFIHGGVETGNEDEDNTRERKIRRFHEDSNAYVLVANPAACSESISLHTVCHHAIYIDRNYNAAQYLQSMDRIHRLGLPDGTDTNIEILFSPRTIDESVNRRLTLKVEKMADLLNDCSLKSEYFEPDLESDGITDEDVADFLRHLNGE